MSRYMLYHLRDKGIVVPIARGIYRLASLPPVADSDLAAVILKYPRAVLCLLSALALHEITKEIPSRIFIALPRALPARWEQDYALCTDMPG